MTYRIDLDRPIASEIRRVVQEEVGAAVDLLRSPGGPDAEGIHEARKSIKKARSAVRLARPLFGAGVARQANVELRGSAASLAGQRDADARVEAIDRLLHGMTDDQPARGAVEELRERAATAAGLVRSEGAIDASAAHGAARQLQLTSHWLGRVPAQADGWEGIESGLRRQYARGRRALRHLGSDPSDEARHDWRKRVKDLWYHERLLRDLWPQALKPYVKAASHLADLLGDDHDLSVVQAFADGPAGLSDDVGAAVTAVIGARREVLLVEARSLGELLYADRPDAWAARHQAWWAARRAGETAP